MNTNRTLIVTPGVLTANRTAPDHPTGDRLRSMPLSDKHVREWLATQPPLNPLPPRVLAEFQAILDGEARRLLRERLDLNALSDVPAALAGADHDTPDRAADQRSPRGEGKVVPVRRAHPRRTSQRT